MGSTGMIVMLVIIALAGVFIVPTMIKKRREEKAKALISQRKDKDEVWKTVKQFLKDNNQYGVEITDTYVARRNPVDYINPNASKQVKEHTRKVNLIREFQYQQELKLAKKAGSKAKFIRPKNRDLYVVVFQTKNIKTGEQLPPQAIECEVITKKIDKKNYDRKILINGAMNYDHEMEWIAPLRASELQKNAKVIAEQEKKQKKIIAKAEKQRQKLLLKKQKREHEQN